MVIFSDVAREVLIELTIDSEQSEHENKAPEF
jgi:hypothetical protein